MTKPFCPHIDANELAKFLAWLEDLAGIDCLSPAAFHLCQIFKAGGTIGIIGGRVFIAGGAK